MSEVKIGTVLITGASAGIGKEVARQLAQRREVETIYLAVRNEQRGLAAKAELEKATGRSIFKLVMMDVSDLDSVRSAIQTLPEKIDGLIMNAGGLGGKTPGETTKEGVTHLYANNLLGHVELLEGMIQTGKLGKVAVLLGSEAARGIPLMMMKRPKLRTSSTEDFLNAITGKEFAGKKFDAMYNYGEVKYIGNLWMSDLARRHRNLRLVTVSPGSTANTEVAANMPKILQFIMGKIFMPFLGPLMGLAHSLQKGSKRIVDVLTDDQYKSGHFYASKKMTLVGPLVDQSLIWPDIANKTYQENAAAAVHRFA